MESTGERRFRVHPNFSSSVSQILSDLDGFRDGG